MGDASSISPSDPRVVLAGIRHFGLAHDRADLQDLEYAFERLTARVVELEAAGRVLATNAEAAERDLAEAEEDLVAALALVEIEKHRAEAAITRATAAEAALRPLLDATHNFDALAIIYEYHKMERGDPDYVQNFLRMIEPEDFRDLRAARAVLADRPQEGTQE